MFNEKRLAEGPKVGQRVATPSDPNARNTIFGISGDYSGYEEAYPSNILDNDAPYWEQWLQNQYSDEAVSADRAWAEAQAQKQMDFQERMSNTSYQRAVADLTKAGLNPALAYSQGGASSATGSMADSSSTTQKADLEREKNMFMLLNTIISALGNITSSALGKTRTIIRK